MRIEWHPEAVADLERLGASDRKRIKSALDQLASTTDARQRLAPYRGALKGFWKLRVGSYRLVCRIEEHNGQTVLVIHVAHRSRAYDRRGVHAIKNRSDS